jgi:hypothetical protein
MYFKMILDCQVEIASINPMCQSYTQRKFSLNLKGKFNVSRNTEASKRSSSANDIGKKCGKFIAVAGSVTNI